MNDLRLIIGVAVLMALFLYLIFLEVKSMNLLSRLTGKYEEGLEIGYYSLEELREVLEKEFGAFVTLYPTHLVANVGKRKIKFFIESGKVFAEYSKDKFGISRSAIQANRLLRASRLKKAVAADKIMDGLAMRYNPNSFIMDNGDYQKAHSYAMQYNAIFGVSVLIAAVFLAYQTIGSVYNPFISIDNSVARTDNPIDIVKEGIPDKYPDITFGKAFDSYFRNTKWKVVKSGDKNEAVLFSGDFPEKDEDDTDVTFTLQFVVDKNSIDIYYGEMTAYDLVDNTTLQSLVIESVLKSVNGKSNFTTQELLKALRLEADSKVASKNTYNNDNNFNYGNYNGENTETEDNYEIEEDIEYDEDEDSETGDYVIPYSNTRYLTYEDLSGMNKGTLRVARNEIYARHGREFKAEDLQEYFGNKDWYYPLIPADEFNDNMLSELERYNTKLIKDAEAEAVEGGFIVSSDELSTVPEEIYQKIKGWYYESSSGGYDVKVTKKYFTKYDRETGEVSSRWKIHKVKTKDNGYLFLVKYRDWEVAYFCEKDKLGEGFAYLTGWDGDWIGYSGSESLSKGRWGD